VEINLHFVLHVGRVIKPFSHQQASLPWSKAFDPDIIKQEPEKVNRGFSFAKNTISLKKSVEKKPKSDYTDRVIL